MSLLPKPEGSITDGSELVEVIRTTDDGEEIFNRKPNDKYDFYQTAQVLKELFFSYLNARSMYLDYRKQLRQYFRPIKDKPMRVERYHVREGEVHMFGDDGSVTINASG